jgi:nucleotide-binding universal stress UspA family protein
MDNSKRIDRILCTTDFSDYANHALGYAVYFAKVHQAKLYVMHVSDNAAMLPGTVESDASIGESDFETGKTTEQEMGELISKMVPQEINVEPVITKGAPHTEIVQTARDKGIDMIVIATHGRKGIQHALFGSTTEKVVRSAPCPVLTIRNQ